MSLLKSDAEYEKEFKELVELLPYCRIILNVSCDTIAEELGVTKKTYKSIENNHSRINRLYYHALMDVIKSLSVHSDTMATWSAITTLFCDPVESHKEMIKNTVDGFLENGIFRKLSKLNYELLCAELYDCDLEMYKERTGACA